MKRVKETRRSFIKKPAIAGAAGVALSASGSIAAVVSSESTNGRLALLGGKPMKSEQFPSWPVVKKNDEEG